MRKVTASIYMTLDGVFDGLEKWHFQFFSDDIREYAKEQLFASDALLLGRVTWEIFADSWPTATDEEGFAERMNSMPKYVASRTLDHASWNSTVIAGDLAQEIRKLKQGPGQDILIYGSGELVNNLMQDDLIDEYKLWIHPVIARSGRRLFPEGPESTVLELSGTQTFSSGVVILTLQPSGATT